MYCVMACYLRVRSPLVFPFGCAVGFLGTVAAYILCVRVHLTHVYGSGCLWGTLLSMCAWLYPQGGPLASKELCSQFSCLIHLVTLSCWSLAMSVHCLPLVCVQHTQVANSVCCVIDCNSLPTSLTYTTGMKPLKVKFFFFAHWSHVMGIEVSSSSS